MKTQTVVSWRRLGKTACAGALLACTALALPSSAQAANRIFNFYVMNIDSRPVKVTLSLPPEGGCYQGSMPNGQRTTIPPGANMVITIARVQGHGCDGEAGHFTLEFDPPYADGNKTASFSFDNRGSMWLDNIANPYPGKLSAKHPTAEHYIYTTATSTDTPALTPTGKARGYWQLVGTGDIDVKIRNDVTNQTTNERVTSNETKRAISASLEAGVSFGPASAKATVSASEEQSVGHSMSLGVMNSSTRSEERAVKYSSKDLEDRRIHAIWQWMAVQEMSDGSKYIIESNRITGTRDDDPPTYLPGSPEDKVSLLIDKTAYQTSIGLPSSPAAAPPAAAQAAVAAPAAASPAGAVPRLANVLNGTFSVGTVGTGFRLTLTGISPTNTTFTGVVQENNGGFGTPATDGLLYADVAGSVLSVGGRTLVRFQKRYRFFTSPDVSYECEMDPATGNLTGFWSVPSANSGGNVSMIPQR